MCGLLKFVIATSVLATAFGNHLQFDGARFADSDYDKHNGYSSRAVQIDGKESNVMFENIVRTGDTVNGVTFGAMMDNKGNPVKKIECVSTGSSACVMTTTTSAEQSHSLDYTSFLPIAGTNKIRAMSHFEASVGQMSEFIEFVAFMYFVLVHILLFQHIRHRSQNFIFLSLYFCRYVRDDIR